MDRNKLFLAASSVAISLVLYMSSAAHATTNKNVFEKKLPNGLDVIVVENHTVPLATVVIAAKNGGYTETDEYNGLSHFYEHMFFKGNAVLPNQGKFHEKIRELGINYNGFTTREAVVYYFTLPESKVNDGIKFMNDAIRTPLFDAKEIEKEKGAVLGEYDRNESSPSFHLDRAIDQKVYWKYFSRVDVIGYRNVIQTVDKKKMVIIQNKFYIPNNCALFVVGDVKHNDVFKKVDSLFSNWKSGPDPFKKYPLPKHPSIKKTESFVFNYPAKTPLIMAKWQGPNVGKDNNATYALDVFFNAVNLPSSKFQKSLVDSGLSSASSMGYQTQSNSGEVSLFATVNADNADKYKAKFLKEIAKMKSTSYITNEELDTAKKNIEISYAYKKESSQDYATNSLGYWWAMSGLNYYNSYVSNVKNVSKKDIEKALNKYVFDKKYVMGLLISKEDQAKNNVKF
ncbi:MAG: insulinase family protein [Candidatus Sericytochromatia bacterium]|nr:insulinase family protein [Candidatus Sericytochromatia bacterium]